VAFIERARARVPEETLGLGSFTDALFPSDCDAVLAAGEVLGYVAGTARAALDRVLGHIAGDFAPAACSCSTAPRWRVAPADFQRTWTDGDRWALQVETRGGCGELRRRIVGFPGSGRWAVPSQRGVASPAPLPACGLVAYLARRR
jgi:hypothetical protein